MLKNNLFVKVALGSLLLIFLRIELVFSDLLPTGGDMGAHIVPTKFFVSELFNNFKLSGWSQDWFAGYPIYLNSKKNGASKYRLGTASRRIISAGYKAMASGVDA